MPPCPVGEQNWIATSTRTVVGSTSKWTWSIFWKWERYSLHLQFQTLIAHSMLLVATDNTAILAYIEKQGDTHSFLCTLAWEIWTCHKYNVSLFVCPIAGRLDMIADALSPQTQQTNTEWHLHPSIFWAICRLWDCPHVDLFVTHLIWQLPTFFHQFFILGYAFQPFALTARVVEQIWWTTKEMSDVCDI